MMGMEMMMKSLGLDPEEIKQSVGQFGQIILDLKSQMDRIEAKLDAVLADNEPETLPNPLAAKSTMEIMETDNGPEQPNA